MRDLSMRFAMNGRWTLKKIERELMGRPWYIPREQHLGGWQMVPRNCCGSHT